MNFLEYAGVYVQLVTQDLPRDGMTGCGRGWAKGVSWVLAPTTAGVELLKQAAEADFCGKCESILDLTTEPRGSAEQTVGHTRLELHRGVQAGDANSAVNPHMEM